MRLRKRGYLVEGGKPIIVGSFDSGVARKTKGAWVSDVERAISKALVWSSYGDAFFNLTAAIHWEREGRKGPRDYNSVDYILQIREKDIEPVANKPNFVIDVYNPGVPNSGEDLGIFHTERQAKAVAKKWLLKKAIKFKPTRISKI